MVGRLIVFEGIDKSGKTTQAEIIYKWLRDHRIVKNRQIPVVLTKEPGGTEITEKIRDILLYSPGKLSDYAELFLYAADRSQHIEEIVEPALANNAIVICDRFVYSTIAYQGYGRCLSLVDIKTINTIATKGIKADLTIWIDTAIEIAMSRRHGRADRIEDEKIEFYRRVVLGYVDFMHNKNFRRIDGNKAINVVSLAIKREIESFLLAKY